MVITPDVKPGACRKAPIGKPFVRDVTIPGCGNSADNGNAFSIGLAIWPDGQLTHFKSENIIDKMIKGGLPKPSSNFWSYYILEVQR